MLRAFHSLACALCRGPLLAIPGALRCEACGVRVPVVAGIPVFTDAELDDSSHGASDVVEPFAAAPGVLAAAERAPVDAYAAFQPFNESARCFDSLIELVRASLQPGDVILDTWNRTGWTGERLAALFPEQRVVSLWEGRHGALGLRGFTAWLPEGRRAANLTLVIASPGQPLPIATGSCALVHAYDTLHRYPQHVLVPELLRVATAAAPIVFPHVHLTSPAAPAFEREGQLRSGPEWARLLAPRAGANRRVFVLGEAGLFAAQEQDPPARLHSDPETSDYNALIGILPAAWSDAPLARLPAAVQLDDALVANPLIDVSALDGTLQHSALADYQLRRHRVYAERLVARLPERIDADERLLLYWAGRLPSLRTVAERLGVSAETLLPVAERLTRAELLRAVPLGRAAHRLQRFHATRDAAPHADEDDLPSFWRRAVASFGERPYLIDDAGGQRLSYAEADELIAATAARLASAGIGPGDRIALWAPAHLEAFLLLWAAAQLGACVAVVGPTIPEPSALATLARVRPRLVFADRTRVGAAQAAGHSVVMLDDPQGEERDDSFSAWLGPAGADAPAAPSELAGRPAIILFTSGTSGAAKGVLLTQQALIGSARAMARAAALRDDDVHLALGDLHSMSGLRNPWLATAWAGAATVVADTEVRGNALALVELLARRHVSVVSAVPAALRLLARAAALPAARRPDRLRLALCTGADLPLSVRNEFEAVLGAPVLDYYGLTETGGLCVARKPGAPFVPGAIGTPVDALVRVVDDAGREAGSGEVGELWVHSAQLSAGYLDGDEGGEAVRREGAWLCTGDLVCIDRGELALVGRRRAVLKNRLGELVPLRDVEAALLACEGVADAAAHVHREGGEEQLWVVVAADGDEAALTERLLDELRTRLGEACLPARLLVQATIPRGASGKVNHAVWEQLGARDVAG